MFDAYNELLHIFSTSMHSKHPYMGVVLFYSLPNIHHHFHNSGEIQSEAGLVRIQTLFILLVRVFSYQIANYSFSIKHTTKFNEIFPRCDKTHTNFI